MGMPTRVQRPNPKTPTPKVEENTNSSTRKSSLTLIFSKKYFPIAQLRIINDIMIKVFMN
jgi:hypothetical protein